MQYNLMTCEYLMEMRIAYKSSVGSELNSIEDTGIILSR